MNSCRLSEADVITQTNVSGWRSRATSATSRCSFSIFWEDEHTSITVERERYFNTSIRLQLLQFVSMIRYARPAIKWTDLASPVEGRIVVKITLLSRLSPHASRRYAHDASAGS